MKLFHTALPNFLLMDAQYQIHNTNLEIVEKAKYLGVTIDKRLSWIDHI